MLFMRIMNLSYLNDLRSQQVIGLSDEFLIEVLTAV